jgi:hypothetical protein
MEEKLTIRQVLEITVGLLEGIEVPMKQMEKIGAPVMNAIHNLQMCIEAQKLAEGKAPADAEEPEGEENGNDHAE